jgi:hypothetical protein
MQRHLKEVRSIKVCVDAHVYVQLSKQVCLCVYACVCVYVCASMYVSECLCVRGGGEGGGMHP